MRSQRPCVLGEGIVSAGPPAPHPLCLDVGKPGPPGLPYLAARTSLLPCHLPAAQGLPGRQPPGHGQLLYSHIRGASSEHEPQPPPTVPAPACELGYGPDLGTVVLARRNTQARVSGTSVCSISDLDQGSPAFPISFKLPKLFRDVFSVFFSEGDQAGE